MTARIFVRLILGVLGVLAVALTAVDFLVTRRAQQTYLDSLQRELLEKGRTVAALNSRSPASFTALGQAANARITWIAADGHVIADSEANPEKMENHAGRPEVAAAIAGRVGSSTRVSPTLGVPFLYVAVPYEGGALRLAVPSSQVATQVNAIRKDVLFSTALAFLPSVLVAAFFARYVSLRLAEHSELEKLERVRKDFVINVSHELRTPLASIQGYAETLLDGAIHDPKNNIKFLTIIRQNAERLTRLTADLLTLSRVELGQQRFQFESYYVNALLHDNADSMRPLAERSGVKITIETAPEQAEVFCDSEAVHQILSNLLDNAIKYTPRDGQVTLGARAIERKRVEIFVRDTGAGIPADEVPRLFERFYRVDKARSRALGGTGLGLAIVKHLVRAQGGEVRVESKVDQGSTFYFTLPVEDLGLGESGAIQQEFTAS